MNLLEIRANGGVVVDILLAISVFLLTLIIFKLIDLFRFQVWKKDPAKQIPLQRGISILELIANIAPLIGLFGTVLGMISAFRALEMAGGIPEMSILAGGIWQALLTTAIGMAIAVIATVAAQIFNSIADVMAK